MVLLSLSDQNIYAIDYTNKLSLTDEENKIDHVWNEESTVK